MAAEFEKLTRSGFEAYLKKRINGASEPREEYLPYDIDALDSFKWRGLGGVLVKDELRELINLLNRWHYSAQKWHAWNEVLACYEAEEKWELQNEFVEALVHYCMSQPASMRDVFTFIVTNAMHQVRLCVDKGYRDFLEGDPTTPTNKIRYLSRRDKERRLANVISVWPESAEFLAVIRTLNDSEYQRITSDYRNRSNHAIAPHFGIGVTSMITRSAVVPTKTEEQPDGTFLLVPMVGKVAISYAFGGTGPLDLASSWAANLEQYRRARQSYAQYRALLSVALAGASCRTRLRCDR